MSENANDAIRAIADAPLARRDSMINDFMAARMGLFARISQWLCRNYGQSYQAHGEDFAAMVAEEAYTMFAEHLEDPTELDRVETWEGMLRVRSRAVVRNFLDKDMAPAAKMTSALRRIRVLNQTRAAMQQELGGTPSDQEVVARHNANMHAQRSNPSKQGVLATVDDLQTFRACADVSDMDFSEPIDTDFVLHPVEGPKFIELLVQKTSEYNSKLGQAAELWLGGLYRTDGPPVIATPQEIATALGVTPAAARTYITKIKAYAVVVAKEAFDISHTDV